jgi:hypothetical protein
MEEYYKVQASMVAKKDAIAHSLLKWEGLIPANLKKHNVVLDGSYLVDSDPNGDIFCLSGATCALCAHYKCSDCPIALLRDKLPCDRFSMEDEIVEDEFYAKTPYGSMTVLRDPAPMITLLKKALKQQQKPTKSSNKKTK